MDPQKPYTLHLVDRLSFAVSLTVFSLTSLVREMLKDLREVSQYAKWAFALTTKFITYTLYRWIFANLSVTILQTSIPI